MPQVRTDEVGQVQEGDWRMIEITGCSDPYMWYSNYIGSVFNIIREYEGDYLVRAGDGFTNMVFKTDAKRIESEQ